MSRVELTDSITDVVVKMSDGNPGACSCLADIIKKGALIDPQSFMGSLRPILDMDDMGIYGTSIYVLWSDKCGRDTRRMLVLLRASQLGLFPREKILGMAADQMREVNLTEEEFQELDDKVCDRLDEFQRPKQSV